MIKNYYKPTKMEEIKNYWDNFNTTHYLNVLTERSYIESHEEYQKEIQKQKQLRKDINEQINLVFFGLGMLFFIYYLFIGLGFIK